MQKKYKKYKINVFCELRFCSLHAYIHAYIYAECRPQCKSMGLPLALLNKQNILHV